MSDKVAVKNKNQKSSHTGLISFSVFTVMKIGLFSLLAWLVLLLYFSVTTLLHGEPAVGAATQLATQLAHYIVDSPSVWISHLSVLSTDLFKIQQGVYFNNALVQTSLHLLVAVTQITLARLIIFILALPLLALVLGVSLTDGLVQRDIRKFQGARESTFLFHRAKKITGSLFFLLFFIYLALPFALSPTVLLMILALALGFTSRLSVTYFKKYV